MKSKILRITTLALAFLCISTISCMAANIVSTDKTVKAGESVTISVKSKKPLGAYKVSLRDSAGLTLVSSSGGTVSSDKKQVTGSSTTGVTSLANYTFKTPNVTSDKKYSVKFEISAMEDIDLNGLANETNTAVITVTAPKEEKPEEKPQPKPEENKPEVKPENKPEVKPEQPKAPSFTNVKEDVYATGNVNVRESYSQDSKKVGSLETGKSVVRTGKGSNGWSRIIYNGKEAYVISSKLTTTKPEEKAEEKPEETTEKSNNKELKSLNITPGKLNPEFNKEVTRYEMTVASDVKELKVEAIAVDEKSKIEITGNQDLKDGENIVNIKVTAEDETVRNYIITVTKEVKQELNLVDLKVKNGTINPEFNKDILSYEVEIDSKTDMLKLDMEASIENASVEVIGNQDLVDGSIIKIILSTEDGENELEYQLKIIKEIPVVAGNQLQAFNNQTANHAKNILIISLVGIAIIGIALSIYFAKKDKKAKKNEEKEESIDEEDKTNGKGRHSI